ncbi:MAG: hypothetical protein ACOCXA_09775 [Planctomycetota bacterium]
MLRAAITAACPDHLSLAQVFATAERARPLLRMALDRETDPQRRLRLALILGLPRDACGSGILTTAIASQDWDEGWHFRGMGQFGRSCSPLDDLLIALGRSGSTQAKHRQAVVDKAVSLPQAHACSHSRALAEAVEGLQVTDAAPHLAALLADAGAWQHDAETVAATVSGHPNDTGPRDHALRELHLARALYRIGDHHGIGEAVLRAYARDYRGPLARHASAVLAAASARAGT